MKRPLRLSFKTQPQLGNWADLERCWQELDASGEFEAGWLFDHFYPILEPRDDGPGFEGWTALAFLAGKHRACDWGLWFLATRIGTLHSWQRCAQRLTSRHKGDC